MATAVWVRPGLEGLVGAGELGRDHEPQGEAAFGIVGTDGCQGTNGPGGAVACGRVLADGRGVVHAALGVVAASPLYQVYQAEWRFSATTLTVFLVLGTGAAATVAFRGSATPRPC